MVCQTGSHSCHHKIINKCNSILKRFRCSLHVVVSRRTHANLFNVAANESFAPKKFTNENRIDTERKKWASTGWWREIELEKMKHNSYQRWRWWRQLDVSDTIKTSLSVDWLRGGGACMNLCIHQSIHYISVRIWRCHIAHFRTSNLERLRLYLSIYLPYHWVALKISSASYVHSFVCVFAVCVAVDPCFRRFSYHLFVARSPLAPSTNSCHNNKFWNGKSFFVIPIKYIIVGSGTKIHLSTRSLSLPLSMPLAHKKSDKMFRRSRMCVIECNNNAQRIFVALLVCLFVWWFLFRFGFFQANNCQQRN